LNVFFTLQPLFTARSHSINTRALSSESTAGGRLD
jgi:hypothetical protein